MFESRSENWPGHVTNTPLIYYFDWWMRDLEHCKTNRKWIFGDKTNKYCL